MNGALAIASRELGSFLRTPVGWIVAALFLALAAITFAFGVLLPGEPASLRPFFDASHWLLLIVAPAISMRLVAEERRGATLELLASAPISEWAIATGKFIGALGFLLAMLAPTVLFPAILLVVASPDPGPILTGYLGLLLVGSLYLAVGLLASSLTSSQIVAFLGTFFFFLGLWFVSTTLAGAIGEPVASVLFNLSLGLRIADFAKGLIDLEHIVFFLGATVWCVAASAIALESERWR